MTIKRQVNWTTKRLQLKLPTKADIVKHAEIALANVRNADHFMELMRNMNKSKWINASMIIPKYELSLELTQALKANDQNLFLKNKGKNGNKLSEIFLRIEIVKIL